MIPFPKQTRCGECGATVRLRDHLWEPLPDDLGEVRGYLQQRPCKKCGSEIVAAIGDDSVLAFLQANCDGAKVDLSPPGYH